MLTTPPSILRRVITGALFVMFGSAAVSVAETGRVEMSGYQRTADAQPRQFAVYLPPGIDNASEPLPVLYLLHGTGGDALSWIKDAGLPAMMDRLIGSGKIRPVVVVMPHGDLLTPPTPENTGENAGRFMHELVTGIMPLVEREYHVSTQRDQTGIAGNSKGARQAVYIALRRPERFGALGAFSIGRYPPLTPGGEESELASKMQSRGLVFSTLLIGCGTKEPTYRATGQACVDMLSFQRPALTISDAGQGRHEWPVWSDLFENHFLPAWVPADTPRTAR